MEDLAITAQAIYNDLHLIPETGLNEHKTSAYLAERLKALGYTVETNVGGTGVIGLLSGSEPGPVLALRADMDALAHIVDGKEVAVHSCGHDANCAMVLTAAGEIVRRGLKKGRLKIIFQPAEEILVGALNIIEAGVIDDVDLIIGIHLRHIAEAKYGQATPALYHGASTIMQATIEGLTSHGARPHMGVNAIDAACLVVQAVNTIHLDPTVPTTVKVTKFQAGGASFNAIADKAELALDLRSQKNTHMGELVKRTALAVETAAASIGAKGTVNSLKGVPGAEYDEELIGVAREAIVAVLGEAGLLEPVVSPGGEDFHFFIKHKPALKTAYIGLGADLTPGLHHPQMSFKQEALIDGVNILIHMIDKLAGLGSVR